MNRDSSVALLTLALRRRSAIHGETERPSTGEAAVKKFRGSAAARLCAADHVDRRHTYDTCAPAAQGHYDAMKRGKINEARAD